jgi:hypothetical protein
MQLKQAWFAVFIFVLGIAATAVYSDEVYLNPDLVNIEKIRESEDLGEKYQIKRLYIFLAIKKGAEYEAYVTRDGMDPDEDKKTVIDEPNDLSEFEMLMTFSRKITIENEKHISYITALPHFDELYPGVVDPFENDDIVEVTTEQMEENKTCMVGSVVLPFLDPATGQNTGIERYLAFYNKSVVKVPVTKDKKEGDKTVKVKTGEFEETISEVPGSFGFIYMILEETK